MVAAVVVLVIAGVDADEYLEEVKEDATEVVTRGAETMEGFPTSTALISLTSLAHLLTKNGLRSVQAVGKLISLRNA